MQHLPIMQALCQHNTLAYSIMLFILLAYLTQAYTKAMNFWKKLSQIS